MVLALVVLIHVAIFVQKHLSLSLFVISLKPIDFSLKIVWNLVLQFNVFVLTIFKFFLDLRDYMLIRFLIILEFLHQFFVHAFKISNMLDFMFHDEDFIFLFLKLWHWDSMHWLQRWFSVLNLHPNIVFLVTWVLLWLTIASLFNTAAAVLWRQSHLRRTRAQCRLWNACTRRVRWLNVWVWVFIPIIYEAFQTYLSI